MNEPRSPFLLYSTCPSSTDFEPRAYHRRLIDVARWSEQAGCRGLLVYADNTLVEPWLVAQTVIEHTENAVPLVAVQPVYAHPYNVAKSISSLAHMHDRRVDLNLVTGGFAKHLAELRDPLAREHDLRYSRLTEYARVITALLTAPTTASFAGEYYDLQNATLGPAMRPELLPRMYVSGSSPASAQTAAELGAGRLTYPNPPSEVDGKWTEGIGIRLGIIARETTGQAWAVAKTRFPADAVGEQLQRLAQRLSDSVWLADLSRLSVEESPYWMHPFRTYKTFCPYLVGSYDEVAALLAGYYDAGARVLILDVPSDEDELAHIGIALALAGKV